MKKVLCMLALTSSMTLNAIGCFPWSSPKAPVQEVPVQEVPVQEAPVQEVAVQETLVQEIPVQEVAVQEAPVQEVAVQEVAVQETPVQEIPVQEVPVQEVPVQETPVQEAPVQAPAIRVSIPKASLEIGSALTVMQDGIVYTGHGPNFVAYSHSGNFAAVTNGYDNTISVYLVSRSTGRFAEISSSPVDAGQGPDCVAFSPDDRFAAVTNGSSLYGDGSFAGSSISIYRVDRRSGDFVQVQTITQADDSSLAFPTSIAYSPDGRFAAVANNGNGSTLMGGITIYAVSQTTGKFFLPPVQTFLPTGAPYPFALAYSPDGRFSSATLSNSMVSNFQVDPVNGNFVSEVPLSTAPFTIPAGLAYSHNGLFAAVVLNGSDMVDTYSVNQTTGQFTPSSTPSVPTGSNPMYIAYSPDDTIAAVANSSDGTITLYCVDDMGTFTPRETVDVFCATGAPFGIAFSPCTDFIAVTDFTNHVVEVFKVDKSFCP